MPANLETQQWPQDWKRSVSFQSRRKAKPQNAQITTQLHSSHASKIMLKILQDRLQQYVNCEIPNIQADLEKTEDPGIKLTSVGSSKKQESSRKTCTSALLTMPKSLTVWITTNYGKFFKKWQHQTTLPAS